MRAFVVFATICIVAPHAIAAVEDDLRDGDKYFEDGEWKKAASAYDRAIDTSPVNVPAVAYGKRAAIYIILKDYKGGLDFIARAKGQYPNAPEILEQEALILWASDRKQDAVKVAERVVKAKPSSFTNQNLIGEFYERTDPVKVAAAYEAYISYRPKELEGTDTMPRLRLGMAYIANARSVLGDGDETRAKQLYGKAADQFEYVTRKLAKKPNAMVNAENGLCAAYTGQGRWDQAINVCERIIQNPKRAELDKSGAVWFNLAKAYLARKQTKKARTAGTEFERMRKGEARAAMILGDTFYEDRDWGNALTQYERAEKSLKPNQVREQVLLSIQLGKTYRRLPAPATGTNPNLTRAIDKLSTAFNANPNDLELASELGGAYLEAKQDAKATAIADRMMNQPEFAKAPPERQAGIQVLAGKALFNQKKLKEARQRFDAARQLRPNDIQISRYLVTTINEQAFAEGKDYKAAQGLLDEALKIDPNSTTTLTNFAVLALDRGDCESAVRQLQKLDTVRGRDAVVTQRLLGRSYLCLNKPDVKKAAAAYAAAESEAKKAGAQLALAEIYTEWVPLTWVADVNGAVEKLEIAVQASSQDADVAPAAKRNLAIALYKRGWKLMRDGKSADAMNDFDRATRDQSVLKGTEPLAFEFSLAVAQLDAGRTNEAAAHFKSLANKGNQSSYLKGAYANIGSQFFAAYAAYRSGSGGARVQACNDLEKLSGQLGARAREAVASCWENVAYEQFRAGQVGNAGKSLQTADKFASADQKRRISLDQTTLNLGKNDLASLEALGGNPPEALVNIGIIYDQMGKPREAYDAWTRAKAKGVQARDLQKWIDAKKRIYGY